MFSLFRRKPITASEAGKLGAQAKHERARAKIHRKCDEMRATLGMAPVDWNAL